MGIKTLAELTSHSEEEISKMRNMGKKSLEEINKKLADLELSYKMDERSWALWGINHIQLIKAL